MRTFVTLSSTGVVENIGNVIGLKIAPVELQIRILLIACIPIFMRKTPVKTTRNHPIIYLSLFLIMVFSGIVSSVSFGASVLSFFVLNCGMG